MPRLNTFILCLWAVMALVDMLMAFTGVTNWFNIAFGCFNGLVVLSWAITILGIKFKKHTVDNLLEEEKEEY